MDEADGMRGIYSIFHGDDGNDDGEVWDMAQMTMGCGRRADSLKLALGWIYHGKDGYARRIDHAFQMASYFADKLSASENFHLVSENPPPCLQVYVFLSLFLSGLGRIDDCTAGASITRQAQRYRLTRASK